MEKAQRDEWARKIREAEEQLQARKNLIIQLLEQLSELNQELSQLKVESQTIQYKVEYQQSLREMHDNNQYDLKLKKLNAQLDQSVAKS